MGNASSCPKEYTTGPVHIKNVSRTSLRQSTSSRRTTVTNRRSSDSKTDFKSKQGDIRPHGKRKLSEHRRNAKQKTFDASQYGKRRPSNDRTTPKWKESDSFSHGKRKSSDHRTSHNVTSVSLADISHGKWEPLEDHIKTEQSVSNGKRKSSEPRIDTKSQKTVESDESIKLKTHKHQKASCLSKEDYTISEGSADTGTWELEFATESDKSEDTRQNMLPKKTQGNQPTCSYSNNVAGVTFKGSSGNHITYANENKYIVSKQRFDDHRLYDFGYGGTDAAAYKQNSDDRIWKSKICTSEQLSTPEFGLHWTMSHPPGMKECSVIPTVAREMRNQEIFPVPLTFKDSNMMFKTPTIHDLYQGQDEFLYNFRYEVDSLRQKPFLVGKGSCGQVYAGSLELPDSTRTVCIKNILKNDELLHEYAQLLKLRDTHCVPWVYGLYRTQKDPYNIVDGIVMEYIHPGRTVESALVDHYLMPELMWMKVVHKTATALHKIHECGVLINDVKTDNLIMRETSPSSIDVVIIDLSHATDEHGRTFINPGNHEDFNHIAPELFHGARTTRASDIYSFGRVIEDITGYAEDGDRWRYYEQLLEISKSCLADEPGDRAQLFYVTSRLVQIVRELGKYKMADPQVNIYETMSSGCTVSKCDSKTQTFM